MQKGSIIRVGNCWMLRYYEPVIENGTIRKQQKTRKLDATNEKSARIAADVILAPINAQSAPAESRQKLGTFLEYVFLPHCKETLRPSTYQSYSVMWKLLAPHIADSLELRSARTSDIDTLLKSATGDKPRAHTTHRNLKNFLSSAFRLAIRRDLISSNPVRDAIIPRGKPKGAPASYTLEEIQMMLKVLPEPARTAVVVAGFTGLRVSEIKGLRWEDFRGNELYVERSVWNGHISDAKTLTSKAPVPILPIVAKALQAHRKRTADSGFIFAGESSGKPLRLENVYRRTMKPVFEANKITCWRGWHAFRRGVGTNLNALGTAPKTMQAILRHSQLSTTMDIYVQPVAKESQAAMKKLEAAFKKAAANRG